MDKHCANLGKSASGQMRRRFQHGVLFLLAIVVISTSGCSLIALPFRLLGSLVSGVIRAAPSVATLLVDVEEGAAEEVEAWLLAGRSPVREVPTDGDVMEMASNLSGNTSLSDCRSLADLMADLANRAETLGVSAAGRIDLVVISNPDVGSVGEAARGLGSTPRSTRFLVLSRIEVGEEAAARRRIELARLRRVGVAVVDRTGPIRGGFSGGSFGRGNDLSCP